MQKLSKNIRQLLTTNSTKLNKGVVYFDSNVLQPLAIASSDALPWRNFREALGIESTGISRTVHFLVTVPQIAELIGVRAPNIFLAWDARVPKEKPHSPKDAIDYNQNFAKQYYEDQFPCANNEIVERFESLLAKLPANDIRPFVARIPNLQFSDSAESWALQFRSILISHWIFQFLQSPKLYNEDLYMRVVLRLFGEAMSHRKRGVEVSVYPAIQRILEVHSKTLIKSSHGEEKELLKSARAGIPALKDVGDVVDSELVHFAIAGIACRPSKQVVAFTSDPTDASILTRLNLGMPRYQHCYNKAREVDRSYDVPLCPGFVVMTDRQLEVRRSIDVARDVAPNCVAVAS